MTFVCILIMGWLENLQRTARALSQTARALMAEIGDLPYASTKVRFMVICAKDYAVKLSSLGICSSVEEAL